MEQNQQYDNIGLLYVCVSICMYVCMCDCESVFVCMCDCESVFVCSRQYMVYD